jgi:hypothetical protein
MLALFLGFLGSMLPKLAVSIGDTVIKAKQTEAARQGKEDTSGAAVAGDYLHAVTEANRARVQARKDEGAWGPIGIITFMAGLGIVYHEWMIVLDSVPWSLFGLFDQHVIGSWRVGKLPGEWEKVELAVLQALFYVAPPAAAAVAVAKVFRR